MTRAEEINQLREALKERGVAATICGTLGVGCRMDSSAGRRSMMIVYVTTRTAYGPGSWEDPDLSGPRYRGRGWVERLADDVAAWLRRTA